MITVHYKTNEEYGCTKKGSSFTLRKSEYLYLKTLESLTLKYSKASTAIQKLLNLDMQICIPEGVEVYLLPTEFLVKRYKLIPTIFAYKVNAHPNQYTEPLTFGVIAHQEMTIPSNLIAARLLICLAKDATLGQKLRWFFTRKIRYVYDK